MSTEKPPRGVNIPKPAATIAPARSAPSLHAAADVRDLAIRERVTDVRGDRARDGEREPVRVRVPETRGDGHVARRPRDEDRRDERQRRRDDHQHHDVVRLVLAVVREQHAERTATPIAPDLTRRVILRLYPRRSREMRPGGFEPPTRGLEVRRSVH